MRKTFSAAVAAAAVTALVVPSGAAFAASKTVSDSKSDTWKVTWTDKGKVKGKSSDVTDNLDVKKMKLTFGKTLQLKAYYADLDKGGIDAMPTAVLKTNKGDTAMLMGSVYKDGKKWKTGGYLITGPQSGRAQVLQRGSACDATNTKVDWSADVITVSIPGKCLGKVKWVKAHLSSAGATYDKKTDEYTNYVDNAHNKSYEDTGWTGKIQKG